MYQLGILASDLNRKYSLKILIGKSNDPANTLKSIMFVEIDSNNDYVS